MFGVLYALAVSSRLSPPDRASVVVAWWRCRRGLSWLPPLSSEHSQVKLPSHARAGVRRNPWNGLRHRLPPLPQGGIVRSHKYSMMDSVVVLPAKVVKPSAFLRLRRFHRLALWNSLAFRSVPEELIRVRGWYHLLENVLSAVEQRYLMVNSTNHDTCDNYLQWRVQVSLALVVNKWSKCFSFFSLKSPFVAVICRVSNC